MICEVAILITINESIPGSPRPWPPVLDGLRPMRSMTPSIFLAVRAIATRNMSQAVGYVFDHLEHESVQPLQQAFEYSFEHFSNRKISLWGFSHLEQ